ncbi:hypothetical protein Hdeb2414_s0014g00435761 [Helianthus debilis subsp. tardiflorus]
MFFTTKSIKSSPKSKRFWLHVARLESTTSSNQKATRRISPETKPKLIIDKKESTKVRVLNA